MARIRELGPASAAAIPKDATVIDGHGKYLMPRLADMHAHTWEEGDFPLLLANGVTKIPNMFGGLTHLRWKQRIASGESVGWRPDDLYSGPNHPRQSAHLAGRGRGERRSSPPHVAEQQAAGYDFLKVYSGLSWPELGSGARRSRHGARSTTVEPKWL
jgi:hypothetical protein